MKSLSTLQYSQTTFDLMSVILQYYTSQGHGCCAEEEVPRLMCWQNRLLPQQWILVGPVWWFKGLETRATVGTYVTISLWRQCRATSKLRYSQSCPLAPISRSIDSRTPSISNAAPSYRVPRQSRLDLRPHPSQRRAHAPTSPPARRRPPTARQGPQIRQWRRLPRPGLLTLAVDLVHERQRPRPCSSLASLLRRRTLV